jgi:hypothetical protein
MDESSTGNRADRLEARRQRREDRRALWGGVGWIGGAALILLGLLLLGQNLKIVTLQNWWALFILLPAIGAFGASWRLIQEADGHFTMRARSAALIGLVLVLVAGMFLFNLSWTLLGPALLILAGVGLFISALLPD